MITLQGLYRIAEKQNIVLDRFPLKKREALALMDECGNCFIAMDPRRILSETEISLPTRLAIAVPALFITSTPASTAANAMRTQQINGPSCS